MTTLAKPATAKDMVTLASHMPFIESHVGPSANPKGLVYGMKSMPYGQNKLTLFTVENAKEHVHLKDIRIKDHLFVPEGLEETQRVIHWCRMGLDGTLALFTRAFGPLATLGAFTLTKIPLGSSDFTFRVEDFARLERSARETANVVNDLYTELVRFQLTEAFNAREDKSSPKPGMRHFTSLSRDLRSLSLENDDPAEDHLWVSIAPEFRFAPFSTVELAEKLNGVAFKFESEGVALDFAQEVKDTLRGRVSRLEAHQTEHYVTTQQIWDAVIEVSCRQQRKPIEPGLFLKDPEAAKYAPPLYACNKVDEYPLQLFIDYAVREASKH